MKTNKIFSLNESKNLTKPQALERNKDTNLNNFTYDNFTELLNLSYLHCHRIKVLSSHTFSAFGISYLSMLTRLSDFNSIRCSGYSTYQSHFWASKSLVYIDKLDISQILIIYQIHENITCFFRNLIGFIVNLLINTFNF